MKLVTCPNGHVYNQGDHETCPYCANLNAQQNPPLHSGETEPFDSMINQKDMSKLDFTKSVVPFDPSENIMNCIYGPPPNLEEKNSIKKTWRKIFKKK
ncbi:MAG: hypothetical protein R3Y27_04530 [Clostridia bacterium]